MEQQRAIVASHIASSEQTVAVVAGGNNACVPMRTQNLPRITVIVNQTAGGGPGNFIVQKRDGRIWYDVATVAIGGLGVAVYRSYIVAARQIRVVCYAPPGALASFDVILSASI